MRRPKCEKCGGALLGEYSEPHVLVVKCMVCGWRRTRETPEHPVLSVYQAKLGIRPEITKKEVAMAKQKECRRCGRMIQLGTDGSCSRCLARIKKGLDPVTGEAAVALVPEPLMAALVDLAEEAVERVTELGEIGVEPPLLPENWGKLACVRCGEFVPFGESCHCALRGMPDDSEGGEEWYEADGVEGDPDPPKPLCRYTWSPVDCAAGSIVPASPEDVAEAHARYLGNLLDAHDIDDGEIERCLFHYRSAFIHGWKHGQEALK